MGDGLKTSPRQRAQNHAYYQKVKADPEKLAHRRKTRRDYERRRYNDDPEYREHRQALNKDARKRWWAKLNSDPERLAKHYEQAKRWRKRYDKRPAVYGISHEELAKLQDRSHGRCEICDVAETEVGRLCVDHDHTTEAVRGLLCRRCNTALGMLMDDPELLQAASAYLRRSAEV